MRLFSWLVVVWICINFIHPAWAKKFQPPITKAKQTHQKTSAKKTKSSIPSKKKRMLSKQKSKRRTVATKPRSKWNKPVKLATTPIHGSVQLSKELNSIISSEGLNAAVAVYVKSMQRHDTLYMRNVHLPLIPASTIKILTAEAAFLYLGSEYRFSTQLLTDAKVIKKGVLQGNLYILLSGDPTLTYFDLVDLMLTLKTHQIKAIAGNVYIDHTAYDYNFYGPGWEWKDKQYCWGAPVSASIINHNCLTFSVTPSKVPGHPAQILTSPKYFYPYIKNSVMTRTKKTRACSLRLSSNNNILSLEGCMPVGKYAWGVTYVVNNIFEYNRSLFQNLLRRLSVEVYGKVAFAEASNRLSLIGSHQSKPLRLLIIDMLKKSDNVIAGALFKKIGQLYTQKPGSWENGGFAVSQILANKAGVNVYRMRVLDGSGVSPANLTTPAQMMQVLNYAYHHATGDDFIEALPIAGVDGTLKHRMANIARKVRAKTGTISGVVSLAGYAMSAEKEPLAFVIMINGNKGLSWRYRALEDQIAHALTRYRRA